MSSFADCPLEVIEVVIDLLQDDLDALKACSQTCTVLLPLCRKYIFQSLLLVTAPRPINYPAYQSGSPSRFTLVGPKIWHFLDTNPTISKYVHTLTYYIDTLDFFNNDVPRVLERLHHVRFFNMGMNTNTDWKRVPPRLGDTLLHIVQSRFITCLEISVPHFPITAFLACVNLTDLSVSLIDIDSTDVDEQESSAFISSNLDLGATEVRVPRLQVFACGILGGQYAMRLLNAKCPNGGPMLDFTNVRTLSVDMGNINLIRCHFTDSELRVYLELAVAHALVNATNKLETLRYNVDNFTNGFASIAPSINKPSLSTLKRLHLSYGFDVVDDIKDLVRGICEELGILSGLPNVIEKIAIEVQLSIYIWGDLCSFLGMDTVLSNGFPMLRWVSLDIGVSIRSDDVMEARVKEELDEIPTRYLPWLSNTMMVLSPFSTFED